MCCFSSDVNECSGLTPAGGPPCDPGTVCVNVPGSYRCSHLSDVGCLDVDPASGQCLDVRPGFCQPGMTFDSAAGQCVGKNQEQQDVMP